MNDKKPGNNNAARRLHSILESASRAGGNKTGAEVWCRAVGLNVTGLSADRIMTLGLGVTSKLRNLVDEVEEKAHERTSLSTYTVAFQRIRTYAQGGYLTTDWSSHSGQIFTGETLALIALVADLLPHEELPISGDDVAKLMQEINALANQFEASSLPSFHKYFAKLMLDTIKSALLDYHFLGIRSIRSAVQEIEGLKAEIRQNAAQMETEASSTTPEQNQAFANLNNIYATVAAHAERVYYIGGSLSLTYLSAEKILPFLLK